MKKILAVLLILAAILTVGCSRAGTRESEEKKTKQKPETETTAETTGTGLETAETKEPDDFEKAMALLKAGKLKEAKTALLALGTDEAKKEASRIVSAEQSRTMKEGTARIGRTANEIILSEVDQTYTYRAEYQIDREGKLLKKVFYASTGEISSVETYEYDSEGRVIRYTYGEENDDSPLTYQYKYDERGFLTEVDFSSEQRTSVTVYTYDVEGRKATQNSRDRYDDGTEQFESVCNLTYEYDEKGNLYKRISVYPEEDLTLESVYDYDEKGNRIRAYEPGGDGYGYYFEYAYDEQGNRIDMIQYGPDGVKVFETMYAYDEIGNLIKEFEINSYSATRVTMLEYSDFVYYLDPGIDGE